MNELHRQIRKLATNESNRRTLRSQAQFAVPRQDAQDRFAILLHRLDKAEACQNGAELNREA